ncbi:MAG: hypothetical protein FJ102_22755 [Deltaproteobacteria bacterium]|nr:hypothetical protein [Deltaproteobacteria bacterium]
MITPLLLVAAAAAYESDSQDVRLVDEAGVFENIEFTTGMIPEGSPIGVEFRVESNGGTTVLMEGFADLTWPDNVTWLATGDPGTGLFSLSASLDAITSVKVDLSDYGLGEYESELDHRTLNMDGSERFDPFVLPGAVQEYVEIVDTTDSTQLIQYSYEIFAGVSLDFYADMTPTFTVGFAGVQWIVNEGVITSENESVVLTPEQAADFVVDSVYRGEYSGSIALVFAPTISVSAPIVGSIPIVSFEYPLELLSDSFLQDFEPTSYTFPMPMLVPGSDAEDLGEVDLGTLATVNIPVQNAGNLNLYGNASIEGDAAFTVYPTTFNAVPGTEDGLVVSFSPTVEGAASAELVLTSNDPAYPDVRVSLAGTGIDNSDEGQDVGDDKVVTAETTSCGCQSPGMAVPSLFASLAALSLAWRRRA